MIRSGRWKLLYDYESRSWRLYDLTDDIGETDDRAAKEKAVVQRLGHKLIRWLDAADAPLATLRSGREPIKFSISGTTYADRHMTQHRGDTVVVRPGEEMPVVLASASLGCRRDSVRRRP